MNVQTVIDSHINFYDHRGKRIALLAPGSSERDVAEAIHRLREQGTTLREIAAQSGLSLSTIRRSLNRLALTEAVEAGERDKELKPLLKNAPKTPAPRVPQTTARRAG